MLQHGVLYVWMMCWQNTIDCILYKPLQVIGLQGLLYYSEAVNPIGTNFCLEDAAVQDAGRRRVSCFVYFID